MLIIVGLGNPGKMFVGTNHNIGFDVVDSVCLALGKKFKEKSCDSLICEFFNSGEKIVIAKPQTYMNNSGKAVKQLIGKYNANPETDLVVIADDYEIAEGSIRIRTTTTHTTHNGIKSIIENIGTSNFLRVKVSIGKKPLYMETADFVTAKIISKLTIESKEKAVSAVLELIAGTSVANVMNLYST